MMARHVCIQPRLSRFGNFGENNSSVRRMIFPNHKSFSHQTVNETGDIGAADQEQLTERVKRASFRSVLSQDGQHIETGQRDAFFLDPRGQARLSHRKRVNQIKQHFDGEES